MTEPRHTDACNAANDAPPERCTCEERCTHRGCHVPATRIVGYRDAAGILRRGYTCGNHESDRPRAGAERGARGEA
jgi:hypothetical protein